MKAAADQEWGEGEKGKAGPNTPTKGKGRKRLQNGAQGLCFRHSKYKLHYFDFVALSLLSHFTNDFPVHVLTFTLSVIWFENPFTFGEG